MTGKAIIKALQPYNVEIRAMVHRDSQREEIISAGATEVVVGDVLNPDDVKRAVAGVDKIYHICNVANPQEDVIGCLVIDEAQRQHVTHFVYHSVLHSLLSDMPHHKRKQAVEKYLVDSGMAYTILQPAALMQNLRTGFDAMKHKGIFPQKFFVSNQTRMNLVSLDDVAEIAAKVLTETGHEYATYEICGPHNLSLADMLSQVESVLHRTITPQFIQDELFASRLREAKPTTSREQSNPFELPRRGGGRRSQPEEVIQTLLTMFRHYNESGFMGNAQSATALLGRTPVSLTQYLTNELSKE